MDRVAGERRRPMSPKAHRPDRMDHYVRAVFDVQEAERLGQAVAVAVFLDLPEEEVTRWAQEESEYDDPDAPCGLGTPSGILEAFLFLRRVAKQIAGQEPLAPGDRDRLQDLANLEVSSVRLNEVVGADLQPVGGGRLIVQDERPPWSLPAGAARGLCTCLSGAAKLRRCPAPKARGMGRPRKGGAAETCGKWFVNTTKRRQTFCSRACEQRDSKHNLRGAKSAT
jgi:hypothetical protein